MKKLFFIQMIVLLVAILFLTIHLFGCKEKDEIPTRDEVEFEILEAFIQGKFDATVVSYLIEAGVGNMDIYFQKGTYHMFANTVYGMYDIYGVYELKTDGIIDAIIVLDVEFSSTIFEMFIDGSTSFKVNYDNQSGYMMWVDVDNSNSVFRWLKR